MLQLRVQSEVLRRLSEVWPLRRLLHMREQITRMSEQTAEYARASLLPTKDVEEAPWNVNVVPDEKYQALKADMKAAGVKGTDPIHICELNGRQYTIDGAHRLRVAKELGWMLIYAYRHPEVTTEEQARLFNYRRDAERGDIDAFKLAGAFKWFLDNGKKQKEIAEEFGLDETTVSRRLSLLNVDPEVKRQVVTDTKMSVSHLEPIASLPQALQKKALEKVHEETKWDRNEQVTTRTVERVVKEVKDDEARRKKLDEAVAASSFKTCPKCGKAPAVPEYGAFNLPWVDCSSGNWMHRWNLKTGVTEAQQRAAEISSRKKKDLKERGLEKELPTFIRTTHTIEEFRTAALNLLREVIQKVEVVETFELHGYVGVKDLEFRLSSWKKGEVGIDYDLGFQDKGSIRLALKKVDYKAESLKDFHTQVDLSHVESEKELKDAEREAMEFLTKYGKKMPRGKSKKR